MLPSRRTACLAFLLFLFCATIAPAQNPPPAAARFARQILAAIGPHPGLRMTFENRSSLGVVEATALRRAIEEALRSAGANLNSSAQSPIDVYVTLSQSWRNLLLIAEIQQPSGEKVVMVPLPHPPLESAAADRASEDITLTAHRTSAQTAPILSLLQGASLSGNSSYLWQLEPGRLVLYRRNPTRQFQWQLLATASIPHAGPWPRDPRALLWIARPSLVDGRGTLQRAPAASGDNQTSPAASAPALHVSLPGLECSTPFPAAIDDPPPEPDAPRLSLTCTRTPAAGTLFPIFQGADIAAIATLTPGRNFFAASIERGGARQQLVPFYSAAVIHDDRDQPVLLAAGLDGKTNLYDAAGNAIGSIDGWGSDLAGIQSGCGSGWQVIADKPGDWTRIDAVTAYEIVEGKAVPVAEPVELPGSVTALATAPDGRSATVVVKQSNGIHETYTITLSCGH
jgi:hypothetical protein